MLSRPAVGTDLTRIVLDLMKETGLKSLMFGILKVNVSGNTGLMLTKL